MNGHDAEERAVFLFSAVTYAEIVRVAFSPNDMPGLVELPIIPSSQPVHINMHVSQPLHQKAAWLPSEEIAFTLYNLPYSNSSLEVSSAN